MYWNNNDKNYNNIKWSRMVHGVYMYLNKKNKYLLKRYVDFRKHK